MIPVYYRDGTLIFWLIEKKCVVEIRLPVFVWRTQRKNKEAHSEGYLRKKEKIVQVWQPAKSSPLWAKSNT